MIRLFLLIAATLAGLYVLLAAFGDPGARPTASQPPEPATAEPPAPPAEEGTLAEALGEGAGTGAEGEPPADLVQASSQTPQQVQRFPGPPLEPSPEHAGRTSQPAQPLAGAEGPILYVTGSRVNMRAGPSTGDAVLTALTAGTPVEALGPTDAAWVNIRAPGGQVGYVSGQFLSGSAN